MSVFFQILFILQQLFVNIWKKNQKEVSIALQFHEYYFLPTFRHILDSITKQKSNKERTKATSQPQLANTSAHYNQDLIYLPPVSG
jgi:hypothetical protein